MTTIYKALLLATLGLILLPSCRKTAGQTAPAQVACSPIGNFDADSAYRNIERQLAFGPRVPGSAAHDSCADYIISELQRYGVDTMFIQKAEVTAFNGDHLPITNIVAGFNKNSAKRVLLVAHYDTRPWADRENDHSRRAQPIPGANDGASGVAVLLEIARNLAHQAPEIGVDFLFVDAEDYGNPDSAAPGSGDWCLGTQYWAQHMVPYRGRTLPVYGILLDMVGGRNARFHYEGFSMERAQTPTLKVWSEASQLGYGDRFPRFVGGTIIDDHVYLSQAGIPTTDIVETYNEVTGTFPPTWHTLNDDIDNIDRETLRAVGRVVLNVLYKEQPETTGAKF